MSAQHALEHTTWTVHLDSLNPLYGADPIVEQGDGHRPIRRRIAYIVDAADEQAAINSAKLRHLAEERNRRGWGYR